MSAVDGAQRPKIETTASSVEKALAAICSLKHLRALMDVVFGGAALALLMMWLVLAIAGGQLT
jgi:hypothetical protein